LNKTHNRKTISKTNKQPKQQNKTQKTNLQIRLRHIFIQIADKHFLIIWRIAGATTTTLLMIEQPKYQENFYREETQNANEASEKILDITQSLQPTLLTFHSCFLFYHQEEKRKQVRQKSEGEREREREKTREREREKKIERERKKEKRGRREREEGEREREREREKRKRREVK